MLVKIISGGQTGVDQAALRAGLAVGLAVGGFCPPGRACEAGLIPAEFPMVETPEERSPDAPKIPRSLRTEWNVRDADATLILRSSSVAGADPGTAWTKRCAARYQRPLLVCNMDDENLPKKISTWIGQCGIRILNVAGPRESVQPGIGNRALYVLKTAFSMTGTRS